MKAQEHPTQCVVYARVSSKEQEKEGYSIPAQLKMLREHARAKGFAILHEFTDAETAKHAGRTGFGDMLTFLKRNAACRIILVEKTDRLYRNLRDYVTVDDLEVEVHLVKEHQTHSKDSGSHDKFMHGVKVLMAKNYIDNLSEETRKGMLEKAEQGIWPSVAPIGYRNYSRSDGKKGIEPDPDTAPMIHLLYELYGKGNHSITTVAEKARTAGFNLQRPIPRASIHGILRNRIYTGDFDWSGKTYHGVHTPIVSRELWEHVQQVMSNRFASRHRKVKHEFPFSGLIACGHCGCSLVGEIKKGRYVYYHCTGYKGKCPEPYVRQEVLEDRFADLLKQLTFDDEVIGWVTKALRESHADEKRAHDEAVARLQAEHTKLQNRIDAMYVDKLDGKIDANFFERKAGEWRADQERLLGMIEEHQAANRTYLDDGVRLLELAQRGYRLFQKQDPGEKRRLLNFVLSNCTWKDGTLSASFRQPFDLIANAAASHERTKVAGVPSSDPCLDWLPGPDSNQRQFG